MTLSGLPTALCSAIYAHLSLVDRCRLRGSDRRHRQIADLAASSPTSVTFICVSSQDEEGRFSAAADTTPAGWVCRESETLIANAAGPIPPLPPGLLQLSPRVLRLEVDQTRFEQLTSSPQLRLSVRVLTLMARVHELSRDDTEAFLHRKSWRTSQLNLQTLVAFRGLETLALGPSYNGAERTSDRVYVLPSEPLTRLTDLYIDPLLAGAETRDLVAAFPRLAALDLRLDPTAGRVAPRQGDALLDRKELPQFAALAQLRSLSYDGNAICEASQLPAALETLGLKHQRLPRSDLLARDLADRCRSLTSLSVSVWQRLPLDVHFFFTDLPSLRRLFVHADHIRLRFAPRASSSLVSCILVHAGARAAKLAVDGAVNCPALRNLTLFAAWKHRLAQFVRATDCRVTLL